MAYNAKLIQSRPNTVVEFFAPSAETIAKLDQFKSEGKIISYSLNELEGDFKRTDTVVYNTADDHASCIGDSVLAESANSRANHCANNGISFSLEIG